MQDGTKDVTRDDIYGLIQEFRAELNANILRLEAKFDALATGRVAQLEKQLVELKADLGPIRAVVYGLVGLILVTVFAAILALVIMKR